MEIPDDALLTQRGSLEKDSWLRQCFAYASLRYLLPCSGPWDDALIYSEQGLEVPNEILV
jgi:hypothetical protein